MVDRIQKLENKFKKKKGAVELDIILKDKFELQEEFIMVKKRFQKKLDRLQNDLTEKKSLITQKKKEIFELRSQFSQIMENEKSAKKYRQQLLKLSDVNAREIKVY